MPLRLLRAALAALALAGCGPASYPGPPQLLLGSGIFEFVAEPSCAQVAIAHGPQGGYHLWTALRARYIDFGGVLVRIRYLRAEDGAVLHEVPPGEVDFDEIPADRLIAAPPSDGGTPGGGASDELCRDGGVPEGTGMGTVPGGTDGWGQALAITAFLPVEWNACQIDACFGHRTVRQEVTIVDSDGRTASDARTLLPTFAPGTLSIYCTGDVDAGVVGLDLGDFPCR